MMIKEEKKQFLFFLGLSILLGLIISSFFFFLASFAPILLNILSILSLLFLFFLSCKKKWVQISGHWFRKIVFTIPFYFHLVNLLFFLLIALPNFIKKPSSWIWILWTVFSFFILVLWIIRFFYQKKGIQNND